MAEPHDGLTQEPRKNAKPAAEKYLKVRFHPKSQASDTENVVLSVNGETLTIRRNTEVVIPERFVECANHAIYPTYSETPEQGRMLVGWVRVYPFDILGDGESKQFRALMNQGRKELAALAATENKREAEA